MFIDYLRDLPTSLFSGKYYLRGLLYNKEVAALQRSRFLSILSVPWDVDIRHCTCGSSKECRQRASRSPLYPRQSSSITPIGRSPFASRAIAKPFSSVVFWVRLSRPFDSTGRKPLYAVKFFLSFQNAPFCHVLANSDRYRWLKIWVIRFCRPLWFTRTNFVFAPFFNLSISPRFSNVVIVQFSY